MKQQHRGPDSAEAQWKCHYVVRHDILIPAIQLYVSCHLLQASQAAPSIG